MITYVINTKSFKSFKLAKKWSRKSLTHVNLSGFEKRHSIWKFISSILFVQINNNKLLMLWVLHIWIHFTFIGPVAFVWARAQTHTHFTNQNMDKCRRIFYHYFLRFNQMNYFTNVNNERSRIPSTIGWFYFNAFSEQLFKHKRKNDLQNRTNEEEICIMRIFYFAHRSLFLYQLCILLICQCKNVECRLLLVI